MRLDSVAIAQPGALGDVMACLPVAAALRAQRPAVRIVFIGRAYSRGLIEASGLVDRFVDSEAVIRRPAVLADLAVDAFLNPYLFAELGRAARSARVPLRIGNLQRPQSWTWANRFIVQRSRLVQRHRALLNLAYLAPLGLRTEYSVDELNGMVDLGRRLPLPERFAALIDPGRFNLVLHPGSAGSAREWPARHFSRLLSLLPRDRVKVFVTGVPSERGPLLGEGGLLDGGGAVDLVGQLELPELISFLGAVDGFVGASTGPLHIAAALGVRTLGLFPGRDRATATRWCPLGPRAAAVSLRADCRPGPGTCPEPYAGEDCPCMSGILPQQVAAAVRSWLG